MKCSEIWLREWVNPKTTREKLCDALTMAGLEVEECAPVATPFKGIIVGQITQATKHPEADRLHICEVNIGEKKPLTIVCGATNVNVGAKVPVARINAVLPNKTVITPATIRGIASQGMLCTAQELGLAEEGLELFEFPNDAPLGKAVWDYLNLDDHIIELSITPNRGDCLSIKGVAREISALTKTPSKEIAIPKIKPAFKTKFPITISEKTECPHYVGRVIRQVKADAETPVWLKERLRRGGIRSISPIVDVTNYVMLELGQPMHAFDLNTIQKEIQVRHAKKGEKIALLDGSEKTLDAQTLVIADAKKPLAIAGVMGGVDSSVTLATTDILLESAYFSAKAVARQRQHYELNSDSAYRFERGIDSTIQCHAIERATQLILAICGGEAGPVLEVIHKPSMPKKIMIVLTAEKISQVLGIDIPVKEVDAIFKALKFSFKRNKNNWRVEALSYRPDITLPEDLIEEVARLYGYDKIPLHKLHATLQTQHADDNGNQLQSLRNGLATQGFHEVISYSFVDKKLQALLDPEQTPEELMNPITADMTVMRTNLWPGLINTLRYNQSRQQNRIRLFEIGTCFIRRGKKLLQEEKLAGVITGLSQREQWSVPQREVDFYDLKGHVVNILSQFYPEAALTFQPGKHPALHPGQTADIYYDGQRIGVIGALHPTIIQELGLPSKVFTFEIDLSGKQKPLVVSQREISKFPEIRRDLAILVNQTIPSKDIQDRIRDVAGDWLKDVFIFDVYQGKGISPGLKSVALALILQHPARTLTDSEVSELTERVLSTLKGQLGAELRS